MNFSSTPADVNYRDDTTNKCNQIRSKYPKLLFFKCILRTTFLFHTGCVPSSCFHFNNDITYSQLNGTSSNSLSTDSTSVTLRRSNQAANALEERNIAI